MTSMPITPRPALEIGDPFEATLTTGHLHVFIATGFYSDGEPKATADGTHSHNCHCYDTESWF